VEKRFQVFVSSTYQDLERERQEVMHALLELDCIPSGMELFPAASDTQWNLIKRVIEDCDYYLLIFGGRYGTIGSEGLSYTEMEYRHALSIGKPIISFVHKDPGSIIAAKSEQSDEGKEKLAAFKNLVEKKLCKYWVAPADLGSVVSRSLVQLMKSTPAVGWVRADELPTKDATLELLTLRKRVEDLQTELAKARSSAPKGSESLAQADDLFTVRFTFSARDPRTYSSEEYQESRDLAWSELFSSVAPLMIHEVSDGGLRAGFDNLMYQRNVQRLSLEFKGLELVESRFSLSDEDFQTIKVQLRALGLMAKSDKPRSVKDSGTYWTLTPYGDETMTRLRAIPRPASSEN